MPSCVSSLYIKTYVGKILDYALFSYTYKYIHTHVLDSVSRENSIPNFYLRVNFVYTELKQMCMFIILKMHICKTSDSIFIHTND